MNAKQLLIYLLLFSNCLSIKAQPSLGKAKGDAYMSTAETWKLKNDSARSNAELRRGIAVYLDYGLIRDAAEAWLTLENYYAFFQGPGYGPRIAYYEQALKLFNSAHIKDRAADTRRILVEFYMQSAQGWKEKKDSARCSAEIRNAIALYLKEGNFKDAAEAWLTLENRYAFFNGASYGPRIAYYERALTLFKRVHATDRAIATLLTLGDFYQREGHNLKSAAAFEQALTLSRGKKSKDLLDLYASLGSVSIKLGNYDKALKYNMLALRSAVATRDTTIKLSSILNGVGTAYAYIEDYSQALDYFKRALQHARKKKNPHFIVIIGGNAATMLKNLNKPLEGYQLIKNIQDVYHPSGLDDRMTINKACLMILTSVKKYGEAKKYSDSLLNLIAQLPANSPGQSTIEQALGKYYLAINDFTRAQLYTTKFEKSAIVAKDNQSLLTAWALQYRIDSVKGDYANELKHYRRYIKLRDLTFDEIKTKQIAQLEVQYQSEKKDQQIKAKESNISFLKKQAQLQAINLSQKETTQKLTAAATLMLALLLGLGYNRYRLKQRVNHQLQQQQTEINQQNRSLTNLIAEKDNLLEEKEWLMKEIHHRVKNNLQIVISLLNTQSSFLQDEMAYKAIRESQHRMQSISLIHQKLYQSDNLSMVNMPAYISDLIQYLSGSFDIANRIKFEINIADIELEVTKSVPLGLILNEAITNSIKYAFPEDRIGTIAISLQELEENCYEMKIHDNGIGLAYDADISKSKTLGMSLMRGLAKQLSGTFSVKNDNGIAIVVGFNNLSL